MKYLIVIAVFLVLVVIFTSLVGTTFIVQNMIPCAIGFYVVLEIVDILVKQTLKV